MSLKIQLQLKRREFDLNVDAEFRAGVTALFGPSGAGKSTLLHCIAGLAKPDAGLIRLYDETLYDSERGRNVPAYRRRVGVVFQQGLLFPHLSVRGNLEYGKRGDKQSYRERFNKIVELLEIEGLLGRGVERLSGGEVKRVALARAILGNPRWLLLDEPFSGLDQSLKDQILWYLRRLHEAVSIPMILVSHCPDEITELADEVVFIENGRLTGRGRLSAGHRVVGGHGHGHSQGHGRGGHFCHCETAEELAKTKSWLVKHHTLRFEPHRRARSAVNE